MPDGPLCLLPFEALAIEPGADAVTTRYWLDAGPVVRYAPSATFLHQLAQRDAARPSEPGPGARSLSVSDPAYGTAPVRAGIRLPRLAATATETRGVRAALEGVAEVVTLQGDAAREPAVRRELAGKRFLHIATHGIVEQEHGSLFAALALAPPEKITSGDDDGFLELFEIYDTRLDCDLAVLSACSSNTGRLVAGEGVFALSRGFLVGGARRVVASQWSVDDESTAQLVGALFQGIADELKAGRPIRAATALRDAKRKLRRTAKWADPFYWAPFVLTGES